MKFNFFLVFSLLITSYKAFSEEFTYSQFCGTYELVKSSGGFYYCPAQLKATPDTSSEKIDIFVKNRLGQLNFRKNDEIHNINKGKIPFNYCDKGVGFRGYSEVIANEDTIVRRTVSFEQELTCSSTSVTTLIEKSFKFKGGTLNLITSAKEKNGFEVQTSCEYKKIEQCNL